METSGFDTFDLDELPDETLLVLAATWWTVNSESAPSRAEIRRSINKDVTYGWVRYRLDCLEDAGVLLRGHVDGPREGEVIAQYHISPRCMDDAKEAARVVEEFGNVNADEIGIGDVGELLVKISDIEERVTALETSGTR